MLDYDHNNKRAEVEAKESLQQKKSQKVVKNPLADIFATPKGKRLIKLKNELKNTHNKTKDIIGETQDIDFNKKANYLSFLGGMDKTLELKYYVR